MKLLYCDVCFDIFNLTGTRVKSCHCGRVKGVYINHSEAITNGNGSSIAIGNGSFQGALYKLYCLKLDEPEADRQRYKDHCNIKFCWIRPNEGEGNPHQFIKPETDELWGDYEG